MGFFDRIGRDNYGTSFCVTIAVSFCNGLMLFVMSFVLTKYSIEAEYLFLLLTKFSQDIILFIYINEKSVGIFSEQLEKWSN